MRFVRTLMLFVCAISLIALGGFVLTGTPLALPAAVAGLGAFLLAIG